MYGRKPKHAPCPCGCGEMADECMTGRNPLAAFTIEAPVGSVVTANTCGHDAEPCGEGLCVDCHRIRYGANHLPTAIRVESPGAERFVATCGFPCDVLDGQRITPYADRDDAVEESRRLHREAIHGPDWRWSTGRGWFANNLEGI